MYGIFDTHAHYDDAAFDTDREELLSKTLPEKGIYRVINVGADLPGSRMAAQLANQYDYIFCGAGIHPEMAADVTDEDLQEIARLLQNPRAVVLGEIGLDYHYLDECPKEKQQQVFDAQLGLAKELAFPVAIHDREAHGDTMDFLRRYRPQGVVHCFSGSVEMAKEVIDLGMYIGLGGVTTFKNARHSLEVAAAIPLERLLLETDCPYMAPEPFRGKRNDSSLILYVATKIGQVRGLSAAEIIDICAQNALRLFPRVKA